ncbi:right-handed parallel beta-helix repeat-containing protein [Microbulbifer sp. SSSA008]|uniref:right-handed parallel beta-helix repeat-containing protein n=1 Tax=Microbulbifer sp. SSSA008 TaxID=3243380 RepID=UPI0040393880
MRRLVQGANWEGMFMRSAAYNHSRLLAFKKDVRQLLQYLCVSLLCASANTYAEVAMDEEVSPWRLSIVGASTGDVVLSGDERALSLGISEICVAENQVSEEFSSSSSEDLSSLGFHSFGSEALSLRNERATVTAQTDQVLLAPTVLSDSDEITLSALINSSTDAGAGTDSLTIYLTDSEYVGYGVQYQGDGSTGVWALVQFTDAESQSNLAQVAATDNHPTTGQAVTLNRSGDTLTVTVDGSDIGLTYNVGEGIGDLSRYGIRSTSLGVSDNNYLDDLTLTFSSTATCPALADTGEWDDAYSLHFVYQELLQQGQLIARLSSHTNSGSGIAGIALRNGTEATDKAIALVMDPSDNSIGLFTRDTDDTANTLITTGQTGALPQWLRLVRDGDTITTYISADGASWTQVDSVSISFDDIVKAGIAVAVTGGEAQTLEYDNLSVLNELSGDITSDMELAAHQTYVVTGDVDINSGVALTVNEGATILFDGNFKFEVNGSLTASGEENAPVVFTSAQVSPAKGDWYGIVVNSGGSLSLNHAVIEYSDYGVFAKPDSTFSLSNSTLQYFDVYGIYAENASGSISNNIIQYTDNAGVYLYGVADVTATGNTVINNKYGFYIKGHSSSDTTPIINSNTITSNSSFGFYIQGYSGGITNPIITNNTITGNNSYGFHLAGVYDADYDPQPVITGNSIYANNGYEINTSSYESGVLTVNATGNWWNTTDSRSISAEIYDYGDSSSYYPIVDYRGYLDAEGDIAEPSNSLLGYLSEDTTLVAGTTYTLLSSLYVQSGVTLTIEPGARLEMGGDFSLKVSGTLDVQGTSDTPVVFTSAESEPSAGDWYGIVAESGGTVILDHVTLEYGDYGLYAGSGSSFSLSNSTLQYFKERGVYAYNASGSISDSTIQHADKAGVYLYGVADVTATGNTVINNKYGFYIKGHSSSDTTPIINSNTITSNSSFGFYIQGYNGGITNPAITDNTITGNNNYGFHLVGVYDADYDPQPVITGNSIYGNNGYEINTSSYESGVLTVNATGNWWNTTDSRSISAEIYDYGDSTSYYPIVDYRGYLDAEGELAEPSNSLFGYLSEDTTLVAGTTYTLLSSLYVQSGVTLAIEPGARLEMGGDFSLKVSGTLDVQGTSDAPVIFTSAESEPSAGDWYGIVAESGGTVILDHVTLEYGDYGLYAGSGSSFSLSNSTLQYFKERGVYAYNASGSISDSTIQHADKAGVYLYGVADVTATGNTVINNKYGFYIKGHSSSDTTPIINSNTITSNSSFGFYIQGYSGGITNPIITNNTITGNNSYGFHLAGVYDANYDPQPVITGNSIYANNGYEINTSSYESGVLTVNATGNWWNTTDPRSISAEIYDYGDSSSYYPIVDYRGYLDAEGDIAEPSNSLLGYLSEDTTLVAGTTYTLLSSLYVQSGVTLTIEPGARLEMGGDFSLKVSGTLDVQGTSDTPVVFTSAESEPSAGDWYGIVAESGGTVILDHVTLEYGDYGLYAGSGSSFSLSNSTLQYFKERGVYAYNASGSISDSTIQHADKAGVYLYGVADVTATGNTVINNKYGFYIKGHSSSDTTPIINSNTITSNSSFGFYIQGYNGGITNPAITDNTITGNNNYGFHLVGVYDADYDPQPVITGNSIYGNNGYEINTSSYESGVLTVNATGNWWNTTDSRSISAEIYDYGDSTSNYPIVDYRGYLDAEGELAEPSNSLFGYLSEDTTLVAGTTYTLLSSLYVQSGVTLAIEPGARLEMGGDFSLKVSGTLDVQGTSDAPVIFTSAESEPSAGDWYGIVAESGGTVTLDYVTLEYGDYGLYAGSGSSFSLSNSTLQYFKERGVYAYNASGSISDSTIQHADKAGVYLYGVADVTATGNTVINNKYGFYIKGHSSSDTTPIINSNTITSNSSFGFYIQGYSGGITNPIITNNTITGNSSYGFHLAGVYDADYDPQPVITGNSIYANDDYEIKTSSYESGVLTVNATGNWWNTTDSRSISAEIYDYGDSSSYYPIVDYSEYLGNANGRSVYDHYLRFDINSDMSLAAGSYIVVDDINVNKDAILTLEAGVILIFPDSYSLTIEGNLVVSGSSFQPVFFTSESENSTAGEWQGIVVASGGSVSIDNAYIQYAETAVSATSPSAFSVTNSIITDFSESGISINNFAGGTISNNLIQNTDYIGAGIALDTASPAVTDNVVTGLNYGAYITGASSPSLMGNSFINNNYGIYLNGSGSDATNPTPTITGNDLYGNTNGSLYLNSYGSSSAVVLNVTGNWWGSVTPDWGVDIIGVDSPETAVDYSDALDAENRVITIDLNGSYEYFSPNGDGRQDILAVTATLSSSSSWDLEISSESGMIVNTFSGIGTEISVDWNGTDSSSTVLDDGRYYLFLKVTDSENISYQAGTIWVELDNTVPVAEITNVSNGDILTTGATTLDIEGSATDNFFVDYRVDYQVSGDTDNWVSLESSTSQVNKSTLVGWAVSSTDGTVEAPANGEYQVRLVASDRAGNISTIIRTVTLDLINIANVSRNQTTVNPVVGESLVISFDLSVGATVTLDIKDEQTEVLVRSVVETFDNAGSYSLSWDGKDEEGNYVQEEAYTYFLTAVRGSVEGVYDIEDSDSTSTILAGSMDATMNAVQNDFMKTEIAPTENIRMTMEVTPNGGDTLVVYDNVPMEAGTHYLAWDGRNADGVLTTGSFYAYVPSHEILPTNVVIIDGITPSISGTLDAPNIEVKSDPYLMYHSYDQISKVAYLLDQDSYVTFKLLPPDIGDPTDAGAITLIDNQLQAANDSDGAVATHEVEWTGYEESDGNAIMVSDEGVYSFWIEATSATTGASTTYYGALQLYQ